MAQSTTVKRSLAKITAVLAALMLSLTACGGDTKESTGTASETSTTSPLETATEDTENNDPTTPQEDSAVVMNNVVNGVDMTFTYYADGDTVIRQTTRNVMPYSAIGVSTADEAKNILDPIIVEFQGVPGLEHSMEYGETGAVETLTVDYSKADPAQISELTGSTFSGDTSAGAKVSLQRSIEMLEGQGFTRVN